jgi:hypothetical protein
MYFCRAARGRNDEICALERLIEGDDGGLVKPIVFRDHEAAGKTSEGASFVRDYGAHTTCVRWKAENAMHRDGFTRLEQNVERDR